MLDAIIPAVAAILASGYATHKAHGLDRRHRADEEERQLESILWGIHAEIVEIRDHYFHVVGNRIEGDRHPSSLFPRYMVAEQSYFTLYESTAGTLTRPDDPALLRTILRTYTVAKRLIDAHRVQQSIVESQDHGWDPEAQAHKPHLVELHDEFLRTADRTLTLLADRHGPLYPDGAGTEPPPGYTRKREDRSR